MLKLNDENLTPSQLSVSRSIESNHIFIKEFSFVRVRFNTVKYPILHRPSFTFIAIPLKIPLGFLDKIIIKFI